MKQPVFVDTGYWIALMDRRDQYADKDFSVTDCCSFVVMRDAGIGRFAGFDAHFEQMGFVSLLDRS